MQSTFLALLLLLLALLQSTVSAARDRTIVSFKRKLNTCDDRDNVIIAGMMNVVYAYNDITPPNDTFITYHGNNRGTKALQLVPPSSSSSSSSFRLARRRDTDNCTYVPPDPTRTTPALSSVGFDATAYENVAVIDQWASAGNVTLYWTVRKATENGNGMNDGEMDTDVDLEIDLAVDVAIQTGWVGLGFSPDGNMPGSDVSISYISDTDGSLHIGDRFADQHVMPPLDARQDYYDIVFYTGYVAEDDETTVAQQ